jgi:hypothetical protein
MKCKHKHEETKNVEIGGYNIPESCTTEYDIYCKDCGKYLGHWYYGNTDLEYFLNTAGLLVKLKFYIKDKLVILKGKCRRILKNEKENQDLPF